MTGVVQGQPVADEDLPPRDDVYERAVKLHFQHQGKLTITPKMEVKDRNDLSLVYTPGVAEVSRRIVRDPKASYDLTWRGRAVAVVTDGSAVLGLGNIGPEAAMPVMEGKALLFKAFGGLEAVPLAVDIHTADELVAFVKAIAPSFAGVNLEDIAAPTCFEVEDRLQEIGIPVFHDDQHGTAIVVTAAVNNAAIVVGKNYSDLKVVISGAGAAGLAISQMLLGVGRKMGTLKPVEGMPRVREVLLVDSKGIVWEGRDEVQGLKKEFAAITNKEKRQGGLVEAMNGADVFIGVSRAGLVTAEMVKSMAKGAIVLAMANPEPEILPDVARDAGAIVVGTGRSDFPNQINNSLVFPGLFKGLLAARAQKVSMEVKRAAVEALSSMVEPTEEAVLPSMFTPEVADKIAEAVIAQIQKEEER